MTYDSARVPTIKLWDLLLVPLQGDIDDRRGEQLCADVLGAIKSAGTAGLIVDVTGLWLMDSHLCSVLSTLASSAALMGTRTVLCGLSPEIAITLQTMGLEMPDVVTAPSLEDALTTLGIGPTEETADPMEYGPSDEPWSQGESARPYDAHIGWTWAHGDPDDLMQNGED